MIASVLYVKYLINKDTLDYVTTAVGVGNNSKADRIAQGCEKIITGDAQPEARLRSMLEILKDEESGVGSIVAHKIEQVGL